MPIRIIDNAVYSGRVGIGTNNPTSPLHVVNTVGGWSAYINNDVGTGTQSGLLLDAGSSSSDFAMYVRNAAGSSDLFSIKGNGNVGIGTTSPATPLHIKVSGSGGSNIFSLENDSNKYDFRLNGSTLLIRDGSNDRVSVTSTGNVGIGTTNPLRKLHVVGNFAVNAGTGEYYGVNITGGEGADPNILIGDWHNSSANIKWDSSGNYLRIDAQHSTSGAPIVFSGNDSAIEYMRITSTGNVGIGTTSPGAKLDVNGDVFINSNYTPNVAAQDLTIGKTTTGNHGLTIVTGPTYTGSIYFGDSGNNDAGIIKYQHSNNSMQFVTNRSEAMRIDNLGATSFTGSSSLSTAVASIQHYSSNGYLYIKGGAGGLILGDDSTASRIQIEDNSNIRFETASSERMRITSAGNVGIGTTSPGQKLTVDGDVGITTSNQLFVNDIAAYTGAMTIGPTGASELKFRTTGSEKMRIASNGNVGIGTTSPGSRLDVVSPTTDTAIFRSSVSTQTVTFGSTTNTLYSDIILKTNAGQAEIFKAGTGYTSYGGALALNIYNSSGAIAFHPNNSANAMFIATNSNVGIGTTSPDIKLEISEPSQSLPTLGVASGNLLLSDNGPWGMHIGLDTNVGTGWIQQMRNDSAVAYNLLLNPVGGNVGIGTTSPSYKLDVRADDGDVGQVFIKGGNSTVTAVGEINSELLFGSNDASVGQGNIGGKISSVTETTNGAYTGMAFYTYRQTSPLLTEKMRITNDGNVGIGTTSPSTLLHIEGSSTGYLQTIKNTTAGGDYLQMLAETGDAVFQFESGGTGGEATLNMYRDGTQYVKISADAGVDSYFNNGANVGIGTTSPFAAGGSYRGLHIKNATGASLVLSNASHNNYIYSGGSTGELSIEASDSFRIRANGSERMRITSTGNVGIGTTNPLQKLQVSGASGAAVSVLTPWAAGAYGQLRFDTGTGNSSIRSSVPGNSTNGLDFYTYSGGSETVKMSILGSGNVGIGTTSPREKLSIKTNAVTSNPEYIEFTDAGAGSSWAAGQDYGGLQWFMGDGTGIGAHTVAQIKAQNEHTGAAGTGAIVFSTAPYNTVMSEKMRITSTGNVGIGTDSPERKLHVFAGESGGAASNTQSTLVLENSTNTYLQFLTPTTSESGILFGDTDNDRGALTYSHSSDAMSFRVAASAKMTILSTGSVGIGTTSPGAVLETSTSATGNTVGALLTNTNGAGTADSVSLSFGLGRSADGYIRSVDAIKLLKEQQWTGTASTVDAALVFSTVADETVSEKMRIDSTGAVLIGGLPKIDTATRLQVGSNSSGITSVWSNADDIVFENNNNFGITLATPNTGAATIAFADPQSVQAGFIQYVHTDNSMRFATNGNNTRIFIKNDGNVGIGTTSPGAKLDVTSTVPVFRLTDNQTKTWTTGETMSEFQTFTSDGSGIGQRVVTNIKTVAGQTGATMGGELAFEVSNYNSNTSEAMRIDQNGNVGIGTTSPSAKLEVNGALFVGNHSGAVTPTDGIWVEAPTGVETQIQMYTYGGSVFSIKGNNTKASIGWGSGQDRSVNFVNEGTGDISVGIGTTSPAYTLDVNGTFHSSNITIADGIYHEGDTNNYFQFATDTQKFVTSGSERMRIASNGNVGIGTTNPSELLTIAAESPTLRFEDISSSNYTEMYVNNFDTYLNTNGRFFIQNQGSTKFTVNSNGNVGIGTTSPSSPLHIANDAPSIRLEDLTSSDNHYLTGNNGEFRIQSTGYITMRPGNAVSTSFLANGNVGIGTTSPGAKLHILSPDKSSFDQVIKLSGVVQVGGGPAVFFKTSGADNDNRYGVKLGAVRSDSNNGSSVFKIQQELDNGSGTLIGLTDTFTINQYGNVGIGTTSPSDKLDISSTTGPQIRLTRNAGTEYSTLYSDSAGGLVISSYSGGSSNYQIFRINSSEKLRIINNGNVGIGTTAPATKLQVDGVIRSKGTSANIDVDSLYGAFRFNNGTTFTGGFYNDAVLSSGNAVDLVTYIASGDYYISTVSASKAVTVKQGGNVGIGTTSPATKLDVDGEITVSDTANLNGNVIAQALPQYADNNAALLAGEAPGTIYYTIVSGDGILKVVI